MSSQASTSPVGSGSKTRSKHSANIASSPPTSAPTTFPWLVPSPSPPSPVSVVKVAPSATITSSSSLVCATNINPSESVSAPSTDPHSFSSSTVHGAARALLPSGWPVEPSRPPLGPGSSASHCPGVSSDSRPSVYTAAAALSGVHGQEGHAPFPIPGSGQEGAVHGGVLFPVFPPLSGRGWAHSLDLPVRSGAGTFPSGPGVVTHLGSVHGADAVAARGPIPMGAPPPPTPMYTPAFAGVVGMDATAFPTPSFSGPLPVPFGFGSAPVSAGPAGFAPFWSADLSWSERLAQHQRAASFASYQQWLASCQPPPPDLVAPLAVAPPVPSLLAQSRPVALAAAPLPTRAPGPSLPLQTRPAVAAGARPPSPLLGSSSGASHGGQWPDTAVSGGQDSLPQDFGVHSRHLPLHADPTRNTPAGVRDEYPPWELLSEGELSDVEGSQAFDSLRASFADQIALLASVAPAQVQERTSVDTPVLSSVEQSLGDFGPPVGGTPVLVESPMVADSLRRVLREVRGPSSPDLAPGSVPEYPGALPVGRFLKPVQLPFVSRVSQFPLQLDTLPGAPLPLSQEDALLLPESRRSASRACLLSDKVLSEWEEIARRTLMVTSMLDSFLGGLSEAVKGSASGQPDPSAPQSVDPEVFQPLLRSIGQGLRFTASSVSRLYVNSILARRDTVLSSSTVVQSAALSSSLRSLPPTEGSLFGPHVLASLKRQAEVRRDLSCGYQPRVPPRHPSKRPSSGFGSGPPRQRPRFNPQQQRPSQPPRSGPRRPQGFRPGQASRRPPLSFGGPRKPPPQ